MAPVLPALCFTLAVYGVSCQQDCSETVTIANGLAFQFKIVPPGTVCFQCDFGNGPATDTTFQLDNSVISEDVGTVEDGVLTIFAAEDVFHPSPTASTLVCSSVDGTYNTLIFLRTLLPPIVPGPLGIVEGETLTLECMATNINPVPTIMWVTADEEVVLGSYVEIENIQRSQAGNYICTVTAEDGSSQSSTTSVTVTFAPDITADARSLVKSPINNTLQLSCSYESIPPPNSVIWTHNGSQVYNSDPNTIYSTASGTTLTLGTLTATGGGVYVCNATNEVGSNSATTLVQVQLPSDPPVNLKMIDASTESVTLSWMNPEFTGFASITSFRATIKGPGTDRDVEFGGENGAVTSYTVTSLRPLSYYTVGLSIVNDAGLQSQITNIIVVTRSLRLQAVENPMISVLNSTAVFLSWQPPQYNPLTTSRVTHYHVIYGKEGQIPEAYIELSPDTTNTTVDNLDKGTVYVFRVVPHNTAGEGEPFVFSVIQTLIDPPSVPQNVTGVVLNPFSVQLSWLPPKSDGGRPLSGYYIQLLPLGQNVTLTGSATTHLIRELVQNTSYEVKITAANTDSQESQCVSVNFTTPHAGDPQPPSLDTFSTFNVGSTFAVISWETPGGYPHRYYVQIRQSTSEGWSTNIVATVDDLVTASNQSVVIEGLHPKTEYDVRVQAENVNGRSTFSELFTFRTNSNSKVSLSLVWIVGACAGGGILITLIICVLICIIKCRRNSTKVGKVGVDDIDNAAPPMERSSHIYEALQLNNIGVYNNPVTFMAPNKAYGGGSLSSKPLPDNGPDLPPQSMEDGYVIVKEGVRRMPEEIYDLGVCNPLHQQQQGPAGAAEESEEEKYEEPYDSDSDRDGAYTNL